MNITCPCRPANNRNTSKQLNTIVKHLSKHLRNSQKNIGKALEDIPKILEILSESLEEDDTSIVNDKGFFYSEHLRSLKDEGNSWDCCTIPCCVVYALKEQEVIYTTESRKENTARHWNDVVQGARETELDESKTGAPCSKHKRIDTNKKDIEVVNTTSSSSRNKPKSEYFEKVKLLKNGSRHNQEGKEDQSLTTSKSHARKSSAFQVSVQDENSLNGNEIGHKINTNALNNTLEEEGDSKLNSTVQSKRECQTAYSQLIDDKQLVAKSILDELTQLSAIEKFSSVLQAVMEGIENCSELATILTSDSPNLTANPTGMSDDAAMTSDSAFSLGENVLENSSKQIGATKENSVKIFDFATGESERMVDHCEGKDSFGEMDSKEKEKLQIDIEAEFCNDNMDEFGESKFERNFKSPKKEFNKAQLPTDMTPRNNGGSSSHHGSFTSTTTGPHNLEESKLQKKNSVKRNKSMKADRGFKFFKRKMFSKSMKNSSTKSKNVGKGSPSWESFESVGLSTEILSKEEDGIKVCNCDTSNRITELENTIKQLENKKSSLEGEKLDLMNALSNIWIEMEDLKNKDQGNADSVKSIAEDKTTMASFQEFDKDEDISDVNSNKISSSFKRMSKSQESSHHTQEEPSKMGLDKETLTETKSLQSETLQSLRIKLRVLNEDKESLSRKLNEMFEEKKVLEEKLQKVSGKRKPKLDKILEENFSFRSRLDTLSRDKLLLEKNNQKLKIEKKKHKLMKLQIQKGCENLIHRINEVLQTTVADKVDDAPNNPKKNPASTKNNKSSIEKFSVPSEASSNVDKDANSVKQIVRRLERTNSIGTEVRARMKEGVSREGRGERPPASLRRAETLNSKTSNTDLTDGKRREIKVNRFPPAQPSKEDKFCKDLNSSSVNETGFRSTVSSDTQEPSSLVKENEADPCLRFFEHLEAKCLVLLERVKVLNRKERNGDICDSMSPQGMCASTQSSSPDEPAASLDNVPTQSNQKGAVLLSCLRNLQKENDNLKLDNLKFKALVANMQEKCNGDLSGRIEDEITTEKNSIQRAEKDLHDLEIRVVPERDVGLLENMPESDNKASKNQLLEDGLDTHVNKTMGSQLRDSGEVRIELNNSNNDFCNHQLKEEEEEEDMSSWHRKYSKKTRESKESAKALANNERMLMKLRQATSLEHPANLLETNPKTKGEVSPKADHINQMNTDVQNKHILRAVSLDEGKAAGPRLTQKQPHPTNQDDKPGPENGLQRHEKDANISPDNLPNNKPAQNSHSGYTCCRSSTLHGHHQQHCGLRTMSLVDESTITPPRPRENHNKTLKKAMSTYGVRDRQYKVHYV